MSRGTKPDSPDSNDNVPGYISGSYRLVCDVLTGSRSKFMDTNSHLEWLCHFPSIFSLPNAVIHCSGQLR